MADPHKKVKLFYLGGINGRGRSSTVTAGQKAFALPERGGFIEVEQRFADELIMKHKYVLPDGEYASVFTTDKRVAARIKSGLTPVEARTVLKTVDKLPVSDLIAEMKRRGYDVEARKEDQDDEEPEETAESDSDLTAALLGDQNKVVAPPASPQASRSTKKKAEEK